MIYNGKCETSIDEITILMNDFKINKEHAYEIINIYFEFFNHISYLDYLKEQIRVFEKKDNEKLIKKLEDYEDACAFYGNNYILITNYKTIKTEFGDILKNKY